MPTYKISSFLMNPAVPYLRTKKTKGLSANWMKTLLQLLLQQIKRSLLNT